MCNTYTMHLEGVSMQSASRQLVYTFLLDSTMADADALAEYLRPPRAYSCERKDDAVSGKPGCGRL